MNISVQRFIELSVRNFDGYTEQITEQEALQVQAEDKAEAFAHVQAIGSHKYRLWCASDWRLDQAKREKDRLQSTARIIEWDKRTRNIERVAKWLRDTSGNDWQMCLNLARQMLNKNPDKLHALLGLERED
jgi:hypothetical protein